MTRTLFVIEDDDALRASVARVLRQTGFGVESFVTGAEALARLDTGSPPDVIITDINMPGVDGIEVIVALRERAPEVPIIAMSGGGIFPSTMLLDNALALGAGRALEKPFTAEDLLGAVQEALRP